MGFKEALAKLSEKRKEQSAYMKELEKQHKAHRLLEERQKSANERELIRSLKETKETMIKEELELERKMRANESKLRSPTNVPSIFNEGFGIGQQDIFSHSQPIMQRNIFA